MQSTVALFQIYLKKADLKPTFKKYLGNDKENYWLLLTDIYLRW